MTTFAARGVTTIAHKGLSAMDIPEEPDAGRMRRDVGARLRAAMAEHGVDALVLLGNGNVVYATGASWPLLDAGLSHVERPVAVVLADDEHPHLFMPFREGALLECGAARRPSARSAVPRIRRGRRAIRADAGRVGPAGGDRRRRRDDRCDASCGGKLFPAGRPSDAAPVVGAAKLVKTPDQIACIRRACRITEEAVIDVQKALAPGVRQIDLSAQLVRRAFELGATTNMLDAIWQVMPALEGRGYWTTTGDLALPLLPTERAAGQGRCAVDRRQHHLRGLLLGLRPHLGGRSGADRTSAEPVPPVA